MNSHPSPKQPFPGLRPFLQSDAPLFFGRTDEVNRILARLEKNRFLAVVGGSGSGKSSLVRAGLLPALEQGRLPGTGTDWRFVVIKPGSDPFGNLATEFQRATCGGDAPDAGEIASTRAALEAGPRGFLKVVEEAGVDQKTPLLLLVDQFEEIFQIRRPNAENAPAGVAQANQEERPDAAAFVNLLLATAEGATQAELPIYVVITMRSDFIGNCEAFPDLAQAVSDSQFLARRMTRKQLQEAIEKPLSLFDSKAAPDLVDRILNDAGTAPDQLPLIQHALTGTWSAAQERFAGGNGERALTLGDYSGVGQFAEAISSRKENQTEADRLAREEKARHQRELESAKRLAEERTREASRLRKRVMIMAALLILSVAGGSWAWMEKQAATNKATEVLAAKKAADALINDLQHNLSDALGAAGNVKAMEGINGQIRKYHDEHSPEVGNLAALREEANTLDQSAAGLNDKGEYDEALKAYRGSLAIRERLAKLEPENADWERELAVGYENVGDTLHFQYLLDDALKSYHDGLTILERLAKLDPDNSGLQRYLADIDNRIGVALREQGQLDEALKSYRDGLAIRERLAKQDPADPERQFDLTASYDGVGDALNAQGQFADALKSYRESVAIRERLVKLKPENADWQRALAGGYSEIGDALRSQDQLTDALKSYRDGLAITERLVKQDPENANWQGDLRGNYESIGDTLSEQGQLADALKAYRDALAIAERLAKLDPDDEDSQNGVALERYFVANTLFKLPGADHTEAARLVKDGIETLARLKNEAPLDKDFQETLDKLTALQKALESASKQ